MRFLLPCLCLPSRAVELKSWRKEPGSRPESILPQACCGLGEEPTCDTALVTKCVSSVRITLWQNLGPLFLLEGE